MNYINKIVNKFLNKKYNIKRVLVDKILLGGENDISGYKYSLMTGDYMRPSTKALNGPHAKFLKKYLELGSAVLEKKIFTQLDYYRNAEQCIDLFGEYFPEIDNNSKIILSAERFLKLYLNEDISNLPSTGHSKDGELIELIPIKDSDCFQLLQGNHRIAFAVAKGDKTILAKVYHDKFEVTPIQFLLENLIWEKGEKIIYQPLPCPELEKEWILARKCTDRFDKMLEFLKSKYILQENTLIDLGSYYGWFVSNFIKLGYQAEGVEKDNIPITIGKIVYKNIENSIHKDEIIRFLNNSNKIYDVVCCLSIMHHFIYGREKGEALELLNLLDKKTNKVLFFEMGQENEEWFKKLLVGWNVDKIEKWIIQNTSFKKCYRLGSDSDNVGKFSNNFGRMLFAFTK